MLTQCQATHHYDGPPLWRYLPQKAAGYGARVSQYGRINPRILIKKRSPMSFFSTTDTGVTLNRFSQDLMLIDMELPVAALNTFASTSSNPIMLS